MRKGTFNTKETRLKMSEAKSGSNHPLWGKKGKDSPRWGKKHSTETRLKMSNAQVGKRASKETCFKISKSLTGRKLSEDTRFKISESGKGRKHSKETRLKMSEAHKGKKVLNRSGNKNHNWKGGVTSLGLQIRSNLKYKKWREFCFVRDGYTCVFCGAKGGRLNVDHIEAFSKIIQDNSITSVTKALRCKKLWDIKNGRTLCIECHKKTDTYGNKKI